jgi:hypothetical protein
VLWAFFVSRLIALTGGIAGAGLGHRVDQWSSVDPARVTQGFGAVGNLLTGSAVRWDALAYLGIAEHGYTHARWSAFFPLYPLLMSAFGWLVRSDVAAGIVISGVSFWVALMLVHRLTALERGPRAADATVILLAFAPLSFFFSAVYTESLFLALSVGAIYAARIGRFRLGAVLAALAAVTRVTGILLVVPLAIMRIRANGRPDRHLGWLLLAPGALLAYLGYLAAHGYGWLSPFTQQVGATSARHVGGPISTIAAALSAGWNGLTATARGVPAVSFGLTGPFSLSFDSVVLLGVLALSIWGLVLVWRYLPVAYGAYAGLTLLVVLSSSTTLQPLDAIDRYVLTIFPLWMAAGAWTAERHMTRPIAALGALLLAFYSVAFATWAFVA